MSRRYAIVDLGTNSARLLVADVPEEGAWQSVADERIACRLGEGLRDTGQIQPAAERRTSEALQTLVSHALDLGDVTLCVLATQALRAWTRSARSRAPERLALPGDLRALGVSGLESNSQRPLRQPPGLSACYISEGFERSEPASHRGGPARTSRWESVE